MKVDFEMWSSILHVVGVFFVAKITGKEIVACLIFVLRHTCDPDNDWILKKITQVCIKIECLSHVAHHSHTSHCVVNKNAALQATPELLMCIRNSTEYSIIIDNCITQYFMASSTITRIT